jgi:hypothetical protein
VQEISTGVENLNDQVGILILGDEKWSMTSVVSIIKGALLC